MMDRKSSDSVSHASNLPLQGAIVSLHVVETDKTKEALIVGGADDGSVAIWAVE